MKAENPAKSGVFLKFFSEVVHSRLVAAFLTALLFALLGTLLLLLLLAGLLAAALLLLAWLLVLLGLLVLVRHWITSPVERSFQHRPTNHVPQNSRFPFSIP